MLCPHICVEVSPALTNTLEDSLLLDGLTNVLTKVKINDPCTKRKTKPTSKPLPHY